MLNKPVNFLEVGCWEGRSAIFWLENIVTDERSRLTCVDRFYDPVKERRFDGNLAASEQSHRMIKIKGSSNQKLRYLPFNHYEGIYIDGSHEARDVLTDAVLCWLLLKKQGVMVFDDYKLPRQGFRERPAKEGIDHFLAAFAGQYEMICGPEETHWQIAIRKIRD